METEASVLRKLDVMEQEIDAIWKKLGATFKLGRKQKLEHVRDIFKRKNVKVSICIKQLKRKYVAQANHDDVKYLQRMALYLKSKSMLQ